MVDEESQKISQMIKLTKKISMTASVIRLWKKVDLLSNLEMSPIAATFPATPISPMVGRATRSM